MPLETTKDPILRSLYSEHQTRIGNGDPPGAKECRGDDDRGGVVQHGIVQKIRAAARPLSAKLRSGMSRARSAPYTTMLILIIAATALCLYVGIAAVLYFAQRSMMYFPDTAHVTPKEAGFAKAEEVTLTTVDGEHPRVWHVAPRGNEPVILYFHGNGGALRYRVDRFQTLAADGIGLVALEYRGYGGSNGTPTEKGLIADAEAAYAYAVERYPVSQIVLWGESLGTGVAVALAAEKPVSRVILEAPFTSAAAVGAQRYWFLPVSLLLKDQFRSDERIGKVKAPLLILHGLKDQTVPYAMGEKLFDLANQPKHIVRFLDGGHEDLDANGALHAVGRFLGGEMDK